NCHPLQSIHRLLNVPPVATVKLGNAYQFEKFGTGNSLLRYGITHSVLKKASWGTRRIFRGIRCKKQAFLVREGYSVPETASCGTRRVF
ncbi:MAG: hypothetical protein KIG34_05485, partial [Bacteroidales bacterium]|nr:hypothetical protein [Bacteroidales bacterium]